MAQCQPSSWQSTMMPWWLATGNAAMLLVTLMSISSSHNSMYIGSIIMVMLQCCTATTSSCQWCYVMQHWWHNEAPIWHNKVPIWCIIISNKDYDDDTTSAAPFWQPLHHCRALNITTMVPWWQYIIPIQWCWNNDDVLLHHAVGIKTPTQPCSTAEYNKAPQQWHPYGEHGNATMPWRCHGDDVVTKCHHVMSKSSTS